MNNSDTIACETKEESASNIPADQSEVTYVDYADPDDITDVSGVDKEADEDFSEDDE